MGVKNFRIGFFSSGKDLAPDKHLTIKNLVHIGFANMQFYCKSIQAGKKNVRSWQCLKKRLFRKLRKILEKCTLWVHVNGNQYLTMTLTRDWKPDTFLNLDFFFFFFASSCG